MKRKVGKMVVCPYCGKENVDGSAFCSECGAPLKAASEAAATAQMFDQQEAAGSFEAGSSHDFGGQVETLTQPTYDSTFEQPAPSQEPTYSQPAPSQEPTYSQPVQSSSTYNQPRPGQPGTPQAAWQPPVTPIPTGGIMVWAIITIFLCTIPGVIALIYTLSINKAPTVEVQQKKAKYAKIWCTIGTVIGVLALIANMAMVLS
ncbi:MAG: zinc-ribbon domain-containing protein [Lachnospiraceae bacterium]|nr:zinc-ribbon domain-containing protein [Lachnospiraceae bacterium]